MKNLFLCFALVGMASTLCAQERGDMLVSGSLSWNSSSTKTTVSSTSETTKGSRSFEFAPQFHYFVINKLSVGLGIGYSLEKDPNGRTGSDDEQLFDKKGLFYFQPMASYYIPLGKKFYYVPRFYIGFGFGKTNRNSPVKRSPKKMRRGSGSESQLSTSNSDRPTTSASCSTQAIWAIRLPSSNKTAITKYPTGTSRSA